MMKPVKQWLVSEWFRFGLYVVIPVMITVLLLPELSRKAFSSDGFMPHAHCYLLNARVIWVHAISDTLIALAYLTISSFLAYLALKARSDIPFQWMFLAFGLFIVSCGATHVMEVITVWKPLYWLSNDACTLSC